MTNATLPQVQYLTVDEVATALRLSKMTVYRLLHAGTIPSIRVGRAFRIPARAFAEYLASLEGRRPEQPTPVIPGHSAITV